LVSGIKITIEWPQKVNSRNKDFEYHHNKCWVHPIEMVTCTISTHRHCCHIYMTNSISNIVAFVWWLNVPFVGWKIFGVLMCPIWDLDVKLILKLIYTSCLLHNFMLDHTNILLMMMSSCMGTIAEKSFDML
jgi:hypothetical protein